MRRRRRPPSQTWRTFLKNHLSTTYEIVFRAAHRQASLQQPLLELPEPLLAAPVRMSDERADDNTPCHCRLQFFFQRLEVKSKNDFVNSALGTSNCVKQRTETCFGLRNELHSWFFSGSPSHMDAYRLFVRSAALEPVPCVAIRSSFPDSRRASRLTRDLAV
jgi:hypothetical protein